MAAAMITFISDFGHEDWFVGVVHGVIGTVCPEARVVDLTHEIPPGSIERAAFVLEAAAPDFPPGTVHLAVVDPGVGTDRRPLAVRARGQWFVGPDNGVLEWALRDPQREVRVLAEARFFRETVSRTFHGRDVFAPVAAHLAAGTPFERFGPAIADPVRLPHAQAESERGALTGHIVSIDRFGNAMTNLSEEALRGAFQDVNESRLEVQAGFKTIRGLARAYGDAPMGTLVALIGSSGRLELAEVSGHAASRWGFAVGDEVRVTKAE